MSVPSLNLSVLCCVYNDNNRLLRALESIKSCKTHPQCVVVVDDGSEIPIDVNNVIEIFSGTAIAVTVIRNAVNLGIGFSRSRGLEVIDTRWVSILDSDDWFHPQKMCFISEMIQMEADVDVICHATDIGCNQDSFTFEYKLRHWVRCVFVALPQTSGVTFRNPGILRFANMRHAEDMDFFLRYLSLSRKHVVISREVLSFCDRTQNTAGGLSGNRVKMYSGQALSYLRLMLNTLEGFILMVGLIFTLPLRWVRALWLSIL